MKTNKLFLMGAFACGLIMSLTSCSKQDEPVTKQTYTISFEGASLNADGYWCGDETGEPFDNWGSTAYSCVYQEVSLSLTVPLQLTTVQR